MFTLRAPEYGNFKCPGRSCPMAGSHCGPQQLECRISGTNSLVELETVHMFRFGVAYECDTAH